MHYLSSEKQHFFLLYLLLVWAALCILSLILTKSLNPKITFDIFSIWKVFHFIGSRNGIFYINYLQSATKTATLGLIKEYKISRGPFLLIFISDLIVVSQLHRLHRLQYRAVTKTSTGGEKHKWNGSVNVVQWTLS